MRLGPHSIVVLRAPRVASDYGNRTVPDWPNAVGTSVPGCSVQPAPSDEFTVDRDTYVTRWVVMAPLVAEVEAGDRVSWGGSTYDVDGDPLRWEFPGLGHVVINLRRSEQA